MERRRILLIGDGDIANETAEALEGAGATITRLDTPDEDEVREALEGAAVDTVAIVSRDDAFVLRAALVVRYVDDDVPMLVTIFDETMAAHVRAEIRECRVTSLADIVAPSLAGPCLAEDLVAIDPEHEPPVGLREDGDRAVRTPIDVPSRRRVRALAQALFQPYDRSAGLLLFGALGIVGVLIVETIGGLVVLGQGPVDALYGAGKTVATVDPNQEVDDGPKWFKSFITRLDARGARLRGVVHRRAGEPPHRPAAHRHRGSPRGAAARPRRRGRASGRSGCGCARCCAGAASASSRSTTARRARTSAWRASSGCRSSSGAGPTCRSCGACRSAGRSRSPR